MKINPVSVTVSRHVIYEALEALRRRARRLEKTSPEGRQLRSVELAIDELEGCIS